MTMMTMMTMMTNKKKDEPTFASARQLWNPVNYMSTTCPLHAGIQSESTCHGSDNRADYLKDFTPRLF